MRKKIFVPTLYPKDRDMSKAWFVKYHDKAGRLQKKYGRLAHITTLKERLKEADRLIAEILEPDNNTATQRENVVSHLSQLLEQKRSGLALKSYQTYFYYLKKFSTWYNIAYKKNKKIELSTYINYLQDEGLHQNMVRKKAKVLGSWFNTLVKRGLYAENPFADITIKKIKAKSKLPFHDNQLKELLPIIAKKDTQLRAAIDFLYYLYFRPAEIRLLQVEHILFDEMKFIATNEVTKDNDNYLKAIPVQMREHIYKYKGLPPKYYLFGVDGVPGLKPLGKNSLTRRMTDILREHNYSLRFTLYSFVHTGIKKAALSGIPIKQLQLQKGHHDLNMFNQYLKDLGVEDCVQLIENFPTL